MLIIKHDHMLPTGVDICLRVKEDGLMVRSRSEIFETLAILGKAKKVLLGMEEEGHTAILHYEPPVAPTMEIWYEDCKVLVRSTVENDEAIKMVNEAIEMVKKVI